MALKPCRECGQEVSTEATACPQCGAPARASDKTERVRTSEDSALTRSRGCGDLIIWPVLLLVAFVLFALVF